MYHFQREMPGPLATIEGTVAKALFIYGVAQLLHCPDPTAMAVQSCCASLTLVTFVATNLWPGLYERYHPIGMHVVPGLWAFVVATHHVDLLSSFF